VKLDNIPPLYLAGLASTLFGLWQGYNVVKRTGLQSLRAEAGECLHEAFGITGFRVFMYPALLLADPFDAANLSNIWIIGILICMTVVTGRELGPRQWAAMLFFAVGMIATGIDGFAPGQVLAWCAGLVWVIYVVCYPGKEGYNDPASAIGNTAAGVLVMALAYIAGNRWAMEAADLFWLLALFLIANAGMVLLTKGPGGRTAKISVLLTPVVTLFWIAVFTGAMPGKLELFALLAITAAGFIASPHVVKFKTARTARQPR